MSNAEKRSEIDQVFQERTLIFGTHEQSTVRARLDDIDENLVFQASSSVCDTLSQGGEAVGVSVRSIELIFWRLATSKLGSGVTAWYMAT